MELKGKIHEIGATQNVTDSFKKRELVLAYADNPQFVEYIKLELQQDNVSKADNLNIGDEVEVSINLRGRPWTNKEGVTVYFNTIVAWKLTKLSQGNTSTSTEDDNLPF